MAMPAFGPVVLQAVGDTYSDPARLQAIVWEGATTAGDRAEVRCPQTNRLLWPGRTPDTQTYLGIDFGAKGINAPYGFKLTRHDPGANAQVCVYPTEL